MKKLFLTTILLLGVISFSSAQNISKNALGLRLGDNEGFGAEISYQRKLSKDTRVELDLGWRSNTAYDAIKVAGVHQWVWNIEDGFNWYAGVGGGLSSWSYDLPPGFKADNSGIALFAAGDIGIEYNFDAPIQLSLDFRPEFYFSDGYAENYGSDIALGIRYRF